MAMNQEPNERHVQPGQATSEYGRVTAPGTVRLERVLPGPIERVWAYLTDSAKRGKWLAAGEMELHVGGKVEMSFHHADLSAEKTRPEKYQQSSCGDTIHGRITRCDPPLRLSYTWHEGPGDGSEVSFELTPRGADVLLVLTHCRLADRAEMVSVASGWHAHLGLLGDHLEGRPPRPFWSTFTRAEAEYEKRLPADDRAPVSSGSEHP